MKKTRFKKLICSMISLSLALVFVAQSNVAMAQNSVSVGNTNLNPGEEATLSFCSPNYGYSIDLSKAGGSFQVQANKLANFSISIKEKDLTLESASTDGLATLELEPRKYESLFFGVKNDEESVPSLFLGTIKAHQDLAPRCSSGATRILAPIAALLGGLLLLF